MNKPLYFTSHLVDILTLPFFVILIYYFQQINNKSNIEWVLYLFGIIGFILYFLFSVSYVKRHNIM